ncbi:hypothetical protein P692DRAFT_20835382 [Suillus brevipes Sb2]|nr:hypothetical protein P692DRAFT_20835382 [Suillus brevipes Sb2]
MMIRGIDGDTLCINDGNMSFMDGRLNTKLGVRRNTKRERIRFRDEGVQEAFPVVLGAGISL